jgi:DNA modification methylase
MKVEHWPTSQPKPYARNPRKNDGAVAKVKASIEEFGFQQPIVVNKDGVIIVGHTRHQAAVALGLPKVPVVVATNLNPSQAKAYRLADNRTNEEATWADDLLALELDELKLSEFDLALTGFTDEELSAYCALAGATQTGLTDDDACPEVPVDPKSKLGDVWTLGKHRLMCGDSTAVTDIDRLMDGHKANMVLTDPPYGMFLDTDFSTIKGSLKSAGRKNGTQGRKYDRVIGDHEDFKPELINTFFASFSDCSEMFIFGADYFAELIPEKNEGSWLVWDKRKESQADAIGAEFELCWSRAKHKRRMLRHDWFGFLSSANQSDARHRVHPTQKPVTLLEDIMSQWGDAGDVVADLYGGSGSTLIACEKTGRSCRMMELDPKYCDVIVKRWQDFTGKQAVHQDGTLFDAR